MLQHYKKIKTRFATASGRVVYIYFLYEMLWSEYLDQLIGWMRMRAQLVF